MGFLLEVGKFTKKISISIKVALKKTRTMRCFNSASNAQWYIEVKLVARKIGQNGWISILSDLVVSQSMFLVTLCYYFSTTVQRNSQQF